MGKHYCETTVADYRLLRIDFFTIIITDKSHVTRAGNAFTTRSYISEVMFDHTKIP